MTDKNKERFHVFFESGYWGKSGRGRVGTEIPLHSSFEWGDEVWHIPAIHTFAKGAVMDFCVEIQANRLKKFLQKWVPMCGGNLEISQELRAEAERENPLCIDFRPHLLVNGAEITATRGCGTSWIPERCRSGALESSEEVEALLSHYGLDREKAWSFHRWSFSWATRKQPEIMSLQLRLERDAATINGIHFSNPAVGDVISFVHPVSGVEHRLTVVKYEPQEFPMEAIAHSEYKFPTHYTHMAYTVTPELPEESIQVCDCLENDRAVPKLGAAPHDASASGIIGSASGSVGVILADDNPSGAAIHKACSALHFQPAENIEWRIYFRERLMEDVEVELPL